MNSGFGGGKFGGGTFRKKQREKMIFIFSAGLALSIFVLVVVVFVSKSATATKSEKIDENSLEPLSGTVTLFTSDRVIPAGTKITSAALKSVYWPKDSVPAGAVSEISSIEGSFAKVDIPAGEPIVTDSLTEDRSSATVLEISPGMRAVTIDVDAKRGIEGWATPGTRVDVVLTYTDDGELTTKVAVENARVLSSGGDTTSIAERLPSGRHQAPAPNTVTLEVAPKDALKLETASQLGKLSLHLRAADDSRLSGVESFGSSDFEDPSKVAERKKTAKEAATRSTCQKGKMKIEGKEYILDCNGNLLPAS